MSKLFSALLIIDISVIILMVQQNYCQYLPKFLDTLIKSFFLCILYIE